MTIVGRQDEGEERDLVIREARSEEIPGVARLMCGAHPWTYFGYGEAECAARLRNPRLTLYVAEQDGTVVAFAQINPQGSFGGVWIELICVDEARRGRGVGTALIGYVTETRYPHANIYLTVSAVNPRAQALYERLGFVQVGEITDYNFAGVSEYLMRLSRGPRREQYRTHL